MSASNRAAIAMRIAINVKGGAYGIPYRIPVNPVLHSRTKMTGALLVLISPDIDLLA